MPVSYRILPARGLVYVRYEGYARLDDTFEAFARYSRDPDARPGQKQFVDLSRLTGFERDFARLMELQANKADVFHGHHAQTLVLYYAPTPISRDIARHVVRSWRDVPSVIALVQDSESEALALLGLSETSISQLVERAD